MGRSNETQETARRWAAKTQDEDKRYEGRVQIGYALRGRDDTHEMIDSKRMCLR